MAISEDLTNTPAPTLATVSNSTTIASSSFSPQAGTLVQVLVNIGYASSGGGADTWTMKDSLSNTYTQKAIKGINGEISCAQFQFYYAAAPGSITVTATRNNSVAAGVMVAPRCILGANPTQTSAATAINTGTSSTAANFAITPTTVGSWIYLSSSNWDADTWTALANTTTISTNKDTGDGVTNTCGRLTAAVASLTATTLGWTTGAAADLCWSAVEILPASGGGSSPTQLLVQPGGINFRRRYRKHQSIPPAVLNSNVTVTAGLATALGAALDYASGMGIGFTPGLATGSGAAGNPAVGVNAGLAPGTGTAGSPSLAVNAGLATAVGAAGPVVNIGPVVQSVVITGANSGSLPYPTTAGNTLIVAYGGSAGAGGGTPSISGMTLGGAADNFAAQVTQNEGVNSFSISSVWSDANCAGGQTAIAVTGTNLVGTSAYVQVIEVAGVWSLDKSSVGGLATGTTTWTTGNTATTTAANEVLAGVTSHGPFSATETLTVNNTPPWVNGTSFVWGSGGGAIIAGYQAATSTGAYAYSGTSPDFDYYTTAIATFLQSTGLSVNAGLATAIGAAGNGTVAVNAGLATGSGTAGSPAVAVNSGLATGAGAAGNATVGVNAGLAHASGASAQPAIGLTPSLATGAGHAGNATVGVNAGLASGTGAAAQPATGLTPGLATGSGTAGNATVAVNTGLATGTGSAGSAATGVPVGLATATSAAGSPSVAVNSGLATGTGTAGNATVAVNAGLAHAAGAAASPAIGLTPGIATGTGTAGNATVGVNAGLAHGAGASLSPVLAVYAGLAHGTGGAGNASIAVNSGLATGAGNAGSPSMEANSVLATGTGTAGNATVGINAGLAHGSGGSLAPTLAVNVGLATATGIAGSLNLPVFAGLATGTGSALRPVDAIVRQPQNLGGLVTYANFFGGAVTYTNFLGGSVTYTNFLGGAITEILLGGSITYTNFLGGTITIPSATLGGTIAQAVSYGGSMTGWTMQQATLALAEFNDETLNISLTSNSSALDLTDATVNMLFKTAAGTPDDLALTLSSAGGSPAITIVSPTGGTISVAIPNGDLQTEQYSFFRIDVVFSGLQNTALYGPVTWTTL